MTCRRGRATWRRATITIVAAYALALHALLSTLVGFAPGSHAAGPEHVLCSVDGAGAEGGSQDVPAGMPAHGPCCVLGAIAAPPPGPATSLVLRFPRTLDSLGTERAPDAPRPIALLPLGSRAPPRHA